MSDLLIPPAGMTVDEAIAAVSAVLDNLRTAASVAPAAVDPDGYPSHVAAGELIESAWGNATVDKLHAHGTDLANNWTDHAAIRAGARGYTFGSANAGLAALGAAAWSNYGLGTAILPAGPTLYDIVITTAIQVSTIGIARLISAPGGVQLPNSGEATATLQSGATQWLVHSGRTQYGPGSFNVFAQVWAATAGSFGPGWSTVVAVPSG